MDRSKTDERQRVLAARGWETDRDRTRVLRGLLRDHTERIYLWFYERVRSRDQAVELTRTALVWISRSLVEIPEERTLDAWVFEHLVTETPARLDLRRSELGPEPTLVLGDDPNTHYLESYPTSRTFLDTHAQYHANLKDGTLLKRSGWGQVSKDLEHFLDGHFGEETPDEGEESSPLRHRLSRKKMGFKQYLQLAALLLVAYKAIGLYIENKSLRQDVERLQTALAEPSPSDPTAQMKAILSSRLEPKAEAIRFQWDPVTDVQTYRLTLYTAKMEPLWEQEKVAESHLSVRLENVLEFDPEGSYLYRIEGLRGNKVVASSGFVTYPPI